MQKSKGNYRVPLPGSFAFLLFFLFSMLHLPFEDARGNVSKSLRNSLLFESSGDFLWSMWDYQTNPYLYALNKNNSISFQFTDNELFSLGSSFLISEQPIFLAIQFQNTRSNKFEHNELPSQFINEGTFATEANQDIRFMLGTMPFNQASFLKNLGLGVYFRWKRVTLEDEVFTQGADGERAVNRRRGEVGLPKTNRDSYSLLSLGVEFGQFSGGLGSEEKYQLSQTGNDNKISYSLALGYNEYGVNIEEFDQDGNVVGRNDAPFLEKGTSTRSYASIFTNQRYFGPKKREITTHFLGWYTINSTMNIGLAGDVFLQPKLKGRDESYGTREAQAPLGESSEVGVESYRAVLEVFYDLDLPITSKEVDLGVLRLTPSLGGSYHTEKAVFDEMLGNGTVDNKEAFVRLGLSFKFYLYAGSKKSFRVVAGWRPHFILHHKLTQEIKDFNHQLIQAESGVYTYEQQSGFFSDEGTLINSARLGLEYSPVDSMVMHIGFAQSDSRFDLSAVSVGLDYIF